MADELKRDMLARTEALRNAARHLEHEVSIITSAFPDWKRGARGGEAIEAVGVLQTFAADAQKECLAWLYLTGELKLTPAGDET